MKSFLETIRDQLKDPERSRGLKDEVVVTLSKLRELVHHFTRIDNDYRKFYDCGHIDHDLIERYDEMLMMENFVVRQEDDPGTSGHHLRWMLSKLHDGDVTGYKAHRWLGFIQGCMIKSHITTVPQERNHTRAIFKKEREVEGYQTGHWSEGVVP